MNPIYLDLHIHTSKNPNKLNKAYEVDTLLKKIDEVSNKSDFLISLTDHNTINKEAYLNLLGKTSNVILGVELHIKNYPKEPAYHCHMYFNLEDIAGSIAKINRILDELYPVKIITTSTIDVPTLEKIIRSFDDYDSMLLPHGGQSHSTFDKSIPRAVTFDTTLERNIYYNQFDGFTARSNEGLEATLDYFRRLGINEFVNLITCTDNYDPSKYPNAKAEEASPFISTWMLALPTFNGLRLSLSESSRLIYSTIKPSNWSEYIKKVRLQNESVDIDVTLTPGLNVVIGGSSSGKTLFVDSIFRKLDNDFDESPYKSFGVENIEIENPSGMKPHYLSQNYIIKVIDPGNLEHKIDDIEIIKNVFPGDDSITLKVSEGLVRLKSDLKKLVSCVKTIESEGEKLSHFNVFSRLIIEDNVRENLTKIILPSADIGNNIHYEKTRYDQHTYNLNAIEDFVEKNRLAKSITEEIKIIKTRLSNAYEISNLENEIRKVINSCKDEMDKYLFGEEEEQQNKKQIFEKLLKCVTKYSDSTKEFYEILDSISKYSTSCETQRIESMGHTLYIENNFILSKEKFLEIVNRYLKSDCRIMSYIELSPQKIFNTKFKKQAPKVHDYDDFEIKIYSEFEKLNYRKYKIITADGKNFDSLSAGWKTSVLLDLILGYSGDIAPIFIDQPEDNLATNYINHGLIEAIKRTKANKQIVLVSHNATIPMLGDAQNVILCSNREKIFIRSSELEGILEGKSMVDHVAEITDGGKPSIKKRVKKYNLKKFRGEIS